MKKNVSKLTALMLSLVLLLSAFPVQAAETDPAPPSWWAEEDYLIFEGDPFYDSEGWEYLLAAREEIKTRDPDIIYNDKSSYTRFHNLGMRSEYQTPAYYYEKVLCDVGDFRYSGAAIYLKEVIKLLEEAYVNLEGDHPNLREVALWHLRFYLLDHVFRDESYTSYNQKERLASFSYWMRYCSITFEELKNHPKMSSVSQEEWDNAAAQLAQYQEENPYTPEQVEARQTAAQKRAAKKEAERQRLKIYLDGSELKFPDAQPFILNNRTMIPIAPFLKALGGKSAWDGTTQTATLTYASKIVKLTIGNKTAYVNGQPVVMDTAPCITDQRTMIPVAYVATFFGQSVRWNGETRSVYISQDKTAAEGSNLEAWALPMGSMLKRINDSLPSVPQFGVPTRSTSSVNSARDSLSSGWSIDNREELINTILSMTYYGHNDSFLYDAALVNSLSAREYKQLLAQAQGIDAYMWPYTKQLSEKWGDRGILCWDLFRMSNLVQWGYTAGYLTYEEALALLEPAATLLCENFSSWEEAYENYLDGYNWWARNNVLDKDIWQTLRGHYYQEMKESYGSQLFDNTLFQTGVIPLSSLSWEDVVDTLGSGDL